MDTNKNLLIHQLQQQISEGIQPLSQLQQLTELRHQTDSLLEGLVFLQQLQLIYPQSYEIPYEIGSQLLLMQQFEQAALAFCHVLDLADDNIAETNALFYLLTKITHIDEKVDLIIKLASAESISNELRYKLFYEVIYLLFLNSHATQVNLKPLYQQILDNIPFVELDLQVHHNNQQQNKDVILMACQFLSISHGPTLTILGIAKTLINMGYNPIIIASNPVSVAEKFYPKDSCHYPNFISELSLHKQFVYEQENIVLKPSQYPQSTIVYQGVEFPFVHIEQTFNTKNSELPLLLQDFIANNATFISIGAPNLHAEIIARYTDVFMLPCSFAMPLTINCKAMICRPIEANEQALTKQFFYPIIESRFPYFLRFKYDPKRIITTPKHIIEFAIIGSRIQHEVDDNFLSRLQQIQKQYPNSQFKFIGIDSDANFIAKLSQYIKPDTIIFAGIVNDIKAALNQSHFCLNPKRNGGGTSILEALSLSIPPLNYRYGDGYHTAGNDFSFDADNELLGFIDSYLTNESFREQITRKCHQQFKLNTNVKKVISDLTRGKVTCS